MMTIATVLIAISAVFVAGLMHAASALELADSEQ